MESEGHVNIAVDVDMEEMSNASSDEAATRTPTPIDTDDVVAPIVSDDRTLADFRKLWAEELRATPTSTQAVPGKLSQPTSTTIAITDNLLQNGIPEQPRTTSDSAATTGANTKKDDVDSTQNLKTNSKSTPGATSTSTTTSTSITASSSSSAAFRPIPPNHFTRDEAASLDFKKQKEEINEALRIHFMAEKLEGEGRIPEALTLYRKSEKLDPHVEMRAHGVRLARYENRKQQKQQQVTEQSTTTSSCAGTIADLVAHFNNVNITWEPRLEQQANPFSTIPPELLHMIIVEVLILARLNIHKIIRLSEVSRGFYVALQDVNLWRMVADELYQGRTCERTRSSSPPPSPYPSLRLKCLQAPRLLFHGIYISANKYHRRGEQRMEYGFHTPHHTVEFYRYLRFFSDGKAIGLTSTTEPDQMVPMLKHPKTFNPREAKMYTGVYRFTGDSNVQLDLSSNSATSKDVRMLWQINLEILNRKKSFSTKLAWEGFTSTITRDGAVTSPPCHYNLKDFLPYIFSPVRSLT
eukprot:m.33550 g.33550  ORF g.33550 m.33550 type:complete len:524 (+) comp16837_c0_seq2:212-1783(+)